MHFHSTHVALGNLDTKETLKTLLKGRSQLIMAIHFMIYHEPLPLYLVI